MLVIHSSEVPRFLSIPLRRGDEERGGENAEGRGEGPEREGGAWAPARGTGEGDEACARRFRIKEEWNFVAECRRKGVPQAAYCRNGFVDTGARLLEKLERSSLLRQSSPSEGRDKRSSAFVFELSGEHWTVSGRAPVQPGEAARRWAVWAVKGAQGLGLGGAALLRREHLLRTGFPRVLLHERQGGPGRSSGVHLDPLRVGNGRTPAALPGWRSLYNA